jgi:hypothetical protein
MRGRLIHTSRLSVPRLGTPKHQRMTLRVIYNDDCLGREHMRGKRQYENLKIVSVEERVLFFMVR